MAKLTRRNLAIALMGAGAAAYGLKEKALARKEPAAIPYFDQ